MPSLIYDIAFGRGLGPASGTGQTGDPEDPRRPRRIDCAVLLCRAWRASGSRALECPRCKGRLRLLAVIEDRAVARRILEHLGLPDRPPARPPPRRPSQHELPFEDCAFPPSFE